MISSQDIAWLAGFLEGEGTFDMHVWAKKPHQRYPKIRAASTDKDVLVRMCQLTGRSIWGPYMQKLSQKPYWATAVTGKDVVGWMMTLYPFMGERRRGKIHEILTEWKSTPWRPRGRSAKNH